MAELALPAPSSGLSYAEAGYEARREAEGRILEEVRPAHRRLRTPAVAATRSSVADAMRGPMAIPETDAPSAPAETTAAPEPAPPAPVPAFNAEAEVAKLKQDVASLKAEVLKHFRDHHHYTDIDWRHLL